MSRAYFLGCLLVLLEIFASGAVCEAGMPSLLPSSWTADGRTPSWTGHNGAGSPDAGNVHWQALSFFAACFLLSAWGLKAIWNSFRREFTQLPALGYGRSLSLVVLWGLCFTVVLTMISGARELMTPGAWKKQGWTYKLADIPSAEADGRSVRARALEQLRFALWDFAATHAGAFPAENDAAIDSQLWEIPGWTGVRFLYVPGQSIAKAGQLLAFEPELNGDERQVLLTNGFLGSMRTREIEQLLDDRETP